MSFAEFQPLQVQPPPNPVAQANIQIWNEQHEEIYQQLRDGIPKDDIRYVLLSQPYRDAVENMLLDDADEAFNYRYRRGNYEFNEEERRGWINHMIESVDDVLLPQQFRQQIRDRVDAILVPKNIQNIAWNIQQLVHKLLNERILFVVNEENLTGEEIVARTQDWLQKQEQIYQEVSSTVDKHANEFNSIETMIHQLDEMYLLTRNPEIWEKIVDLLKRHNRRIIPRKPKPMALWAHYRVHMDIGEKLKPELEAILNQIENKEQLLFPDELKPVKEAFFDELKMIKWRRLKVLPNAFVYRVIGMVDGEKVYLEYNTSNKQAQAFKLNKISAPNLSNSVLKERLSQLVQQMTLEYTEHNQDYAIAEKVIQNQRQIYTVCGNY